MWNTYVELQFYFYDKKSVILFSGNDDDIIISTSSGRGSGHPAFILLLVIHNRFAFSKRALILWFLVCVQYAQCYPPCLLAMANLIRNDPQKITFLENGRNKAKTTAVFTRSHSECTQKANRKNETCPIWWNRYGFSMFYHYYSCIW